MASDNCDMTCKNFVVYACRDPWNRNSNNLVKPSSQSLGHEPFTDLVLVKNSCGWHWAAVFVLAERLREVAIPRLGDRPEVGKHSAHKLVRRFTLHLVAVLGIILLSADNTELQVFRFLALNGWRLALFSVAGAAALGMQSFTPCTH
ncbi:hypothetical protein CCR75_001942 [Bremia lactucae]|uniref:Uncharacterized protein n=1 Tax=Bremia lactucae TaxID=4779 RepID=A0A976FS28_BRELC|nr:hypothetical protein CCR75_001942 [Bremia lactucae]